MKIDFLRIRSKFKNLDRVSVQFDKSNLMTVIVGRNGSGKSNILEALVAIFRNLDLGEPPPFSYEIRYKLGAGSGVRWVYIDADPDRTPIAKQYIISVTNTETGELDKARQVPLSKVCRGKDGKADYLPKYIFAYYSGPSDRLENYFKKHRTDFYRKLLRNQVDLGGDIRPLFYAKPTHSQFVLLAFFLSDKNEKERNFLLKHLGIVGLDAVHFVMRRPDWAKNANRNERFWGADGVVRDFLDSLYPHTLAPLRISRPEDTSLTGKRIQNEFIHLFVPDLSSLHRFAKKLSPDVFFKMLESTLLSEIISEVRVRVIVQGCDEPLSFRELSEGEQQLLTVLGLLKFTGGSDSLFLLDEPDTHLNPAWAAKYLEFLRDFVPNHETSHLLMVSHHPLAIAELEKEQVQVMWRDEASQVHATEPASSPRGMGYAGILTSDMFGLRTTLDTPTENLIRQRRELTEKSNLEQPELNKLKEIDAELNSLGFSTAHWDTDYREYLQLRKAVEDELFSSSSDTPAIHAKRRTTATRLIRELEKKTSGKQNEKN